VGEKELYNAIVLDYQYDNEMPREDFYGRWK
jgi:hypothetical protein